MRRASAFIAAVASCAIAAAANNPPLSGSWNIAPTGSATSNGELLFRMTPGDGGDPVEVTVSVRSGTNDLAVARTIRQALSVQLARDRFNVRLGDGANVLVSDPLGQPNFSLELIDSNVENLRVVVQSVTAAPPPTVPEQSVPAVPPQAVPAPNAAAGDAAPPATPPPSANPPPIPGGTPTPGANSPAGQPATTPPPPNGTAPGPAADAPTPKL